MELKFKSGDRVAWQYTHHFNSKSRAVRVKKGEYYGRIRHTIRYEGEQLAMVLFDGNKRVSTVEVNQLRKL